MDIGIEHYVILSGLLFALGAFGVFWGHKTVISVLLSLELMLLAVNLNFVAFSGFLGDLVGQVFTFLILTVAAAETAIGLAILVVFYRKLQKIDLDSFKEMHH